MPLQKNTFFHVKYKIYLYMCSVFSPSAKEIKLEAEAVVHPCISY
jgi:hypothetical protein